MDEPHFVTVTAAQRTALPADAALDTSQTRAVEGVAAGQQHLWRQCKGILADGTRLVGIATCARLSLDGVPLGLRQGSRRGCAYQCQLLS